MNNKEPREFSNFDDIPGNDGYGNNIYEPRYCLPEEEEPDDEDFEIPKENTIVVKDTGSWMCVNDVENKK